MTVTYTLEIQTSFMRKIRTITIALLGRKSLFVISIWAHNYS